ncbi:MAG: coproporphyrinogen dehydrogenase HemZ [bacterium]
MFNHKLSSIIYYFTHHKHIDEVLCILQLYFFGEKIVQGTRNKDFKSFREFNEILEGSIKSYQEIGLDLNTNIFIIKSYFQKDDNDNNKAVCCQVFQKNLLTLELDLLAQSSHELDLKTLDLPQSNMFNKEISRLIKLTVFKALSQVRLINMPWGILTGIRPTKKVNELLENGYTEAQIKNTLREKYLVSDDKINLVHDIARHEKDIIKDNYKKKVGIYIGIPFCPTRCVYCSFTSFNLSQYEKKVDLYLDCLEKELVSFVDYYKNNLDNNNKIELESVYIGGGTPTSLNENQFERFLNIVNINLIKNNSFINNNILEYTVEAGRADTITRKKLELLKEFGVTRISINPQTMRDKTLKLIGRNHTADDFINAFNMAREVGHNNINADIILGLNEENSSDVEYTMKELLKLNPESLTVHTLSLKRASRLNEILEEFSPQPFYEMDKMVRIAGEYASKMDMYGYYMYRQKNTLGNFENVGYCKEGFESVYNIQIMEEKQSIISFGAGSTTKFYFEEKNLLNRVFNLKSVDEYIRRIDEMIEKKTIGLEEWLEN